MKNSIYTVCFLAASGVFGTAQAGSITFNIDEVGSLGGLTSDPYVEAKAEEIPNFLRFTFDVTSVSNILADLRGVFFNISNEALIGTFSLDHALAYDQSGTEISGVSFDLCQSTTGLDTCGSNNNLNGVAILFDVAVESGTQGTADDDVDKIVFDLVSTSADDNNPLTLSLIADQIFGARLMSVGTVENREGSLKLVTTSPAYTPPDPDPNPVPAPAPLALIGLGGLLLGLLRRRSSA